MKSYLPVINNGEISLITKNKGLRRV